MATRWQAPFLAFLLTPQISTVTIIINSSSALKCVGDQAALPTCEWRSRRGAWAAGRGDVPGSWRQGEEGRVRGEDIPSKAPNPAQCSHRPLKAAVLPSVLARSPYLSKLNGTIPLILI